VGGRPRSLDHLIDPDEIAKLISTTRHLTDGAFEDIVSEAGLLSLGEVSPPGEGHAARPLKQQIT
jgi:hypothetical protein